MPKLLPVTVKRASHCVSCSLPWRWWIWMIACMFASETSVFRRVEGICLVTTTHFLCTVGEWERKESCEVSGVVTASFQSWLRPSVAGVWRPAQTPWLFNCTEITHCDEMAALFAVGRAWPWAWEELYPWLCLLRALVLDSNSLCHLVGAPLPWERSSGDRDRFGAGGRLLELCYNRNANTGCFFFFALK